MESEPIELKCTTIHVEKKNSSGNLFQGKVTVTWMRKKKSKKLPQFFWMLQRSLVSLVSKNLV